MDEPYVELCGITEKEIHHYLEPEIRQLAKYQKMSYEDACRELKERYDGYHFTENSIGLYNPFRLFRSLNTLTLPNLVTPVKRAKRIYPSIVFSTE